MCPPRPIVVTHVGVVTQVVYVGDTVSKSKLTLGVSAVGATTDVVQETLSLTAGIAASTNVYKDMRKENTSFRAVPGQIVSFKVTATNAGGAATGTFYPYFLYYFEGNKRNATYDVRYE